MTYTHNTKVCSKCGIKRQINQFAKSSCTKDGLQTKCKFCDKAYREANKEKIKAYITKYAIDNRQSLLEKKREYRIKNIERIREKDKIWAKNNQEKVKANQEKQWLLNRKKYYAKNVKRESERRKTDYMYNMRKRVSHRVRMALKGIGLSKSKSTKEMLGCSWHELKTHIENQFVEGMSWENRSAWHIDHIIPLASAKSEEDVIRLNHYTNLQPLWAADNIRKSDKMDFQL